MTKYDRKHLYAVYNPTSDSFINAVLYSTGNKYFYFNQWIAIMVSLNWIIGEVADGYKDTTTLDRNNPKHCYRHDGNMSQTCQQYKSDNKHIFSVESDMMSACM